MALKPIQNDQAEARNQMKILTLNSAKKIMKNVIFQNLKKKNLKDSKESMEFQIFTLGPKVL